MAKVVEIQDRAGEYMFHCIACGFCHSFATITPNANGAKWKFENNDVNSPTFSPSLDFKWLDDQGNIIKRCHLHVKNGQIQYGIDCTHKLAGQVVDMEEFT